MSGLKTRGYELKVIKILSLSILILFLFIYSAVAIFGIGNNSIGSGSSSTINSEADIGDNTSIEQNLSSVNSDENSSLIKSDTSSTTPGTSFNNNVSAEVEVSSRYNSSNDATITSDIHWGYIWMSIEEMRIATNTFELRRYSEDIDSNTCSVPKYDLKSDKFFEIMNIVKKYNWTEHRQYINAVQLKACEITVIGNNRVYTYLRFGRDENGRCFVWSFYDYKIAYLSKQDYKYIENIFINAG